MSDATKTLLHPFETGMLDLPEAGRVLALNATETLLRGLDHAKVDAVQDFRPELLKLERAGFRVTPQATGDGYAMALVLCGRHRQINEHCVFAANARVTPGGLVVIAGLKTDGADSLRKRLKAPFAIEGQAAKHHGNVFWFKADGAPAEVLDTTIVDGRFETMPGMFSHERVDPGSALLAMNLPSDLHGSVADLGAGWGYLSVEIAARCPKVRRIDLYEASHAAAKAAEANMKRLAGAMASSTHWLDAATEGPRERYDAVVMNPPFHTGRSGDPDIGKAMIAGAWWLLKPGGRLHLVANVHLPYEIVLADLFAASGQTVREAGFKVLWARK
jgi:16S rRNA (guanine1207-N2)-methyltransferase